MFWAASESSRLEQQLSGGAGLESSVLTEAAEPAPGESVGAPALVASLTVEANVPAASVFVDGERVGDTGEPLAVSPEIVVLRVEKDG